jgi:shikimate kinase
MNKIVFGFKGCGKTHFGQLLAQKLKCPFVDTDHLMLEFYGEPSQSTIQDLYQSVGEKEFRALEKKAVGRLLGVENSVIALGGGTILDSENLVTLQRLGILIYLQVELTTLERRGISFLVGSIETIYQERIFLYESIPAYRIRVDSGEESEILASLHALARLGESTYGL